MQKQRQSIDPRHQEVQGDRGRLNRQENYHARGKDPQDGETSQPSRTQGSLQEEGHSLSSFLVRPKQPFRGARKITRWTGPRADSFAHLSVTEGPSIPTLLKYHA